MSEACERTVRIGTVGRRWAGDARGRWLAVVIVGVVAVAARLGVVVASGGLRGDYDYDPSVYFAAADALTHGKVPYRDFVLLHPPLLPLVLTPFAALGRCTTELTGFVAASLAFAVLGAVNAVLVTVVARRAGLPFRAATVGGLVYAVWFGAVRAEYTTRLEPLGNAFLLLALVLLTAPPRASVSRRGVVVAGVMLGLAASVKVWFVVPLAVCAVYLLVRRGVRPALLLLVGSLVAGLVVDGSFLVLSGGRMWSMVVLDQLGRQPVVVSSYERVAGLIGGDMLSPPVRAVCVAAGVVVFAWAVPRALRSGRGGLAVSLFCAQLLVLLLAPSSFGFYADFLAPPLALVAAHACVPAAARDGLTVGRPAARALLPGAAAAVLGAVCTAWLVASGGFVGVLPFPHRDRLVAAARPLRCVTADSPMSLIELNVLDRSFGPSCTDWVDVTGRTYGVDRSSRTRSYNYRWQRALCRYLLSGQAVILRRDSWTGISHTVLDDIDRGRRLAGAPADALWQPRRPQPSCRHILRRSAAARLRSA